MSNYFDSNRRGKYAEGVSLTAKSETSDASTFMVCNGCGKKVAGGSYIMNVFYCPMCLSIINRNNRAEVLAPPESPNLPQMSDIPKVPEVPKIPYWPTIDMFDIPEACKGCSNHPSNGGSGICHCTVPYFHRERKQYPKPGRTITTTGTGGINQQPTTWNGTFNPNIEIPNQK
jgi:hypothetical protein